MADTNYIPAREDIIFPDFNPAKKTEIGKYRPALVLSSRNDNFQTGVLICIPVSRRIRGGTLEVAVNNPEKPSVVATGIIQTLSWRECKAKFVVNAEDHVMNEVLGRVLPLNILLRINP